MRWRSLEGEGTIQVNTATGSQGTKLTPGAKAGIAIGSLVVAVGIIASVEYPAVPECKSTRPALFSTQYIYNSCDFPVNAIVCREYPFGTAGGTCDSARSFSANADYAAMAAEETSIPVGVFVPFRVSVFPCRAGYNPVVTDMRTRAYRCDKLE